MRLLLSFILTSFFFIAPHKSDAKLVVSKEMTVTFAKSFSQTEAAVFLDCSHPSTITFQRTNVRSVSNQYRSVTGIEPGYAGQLPAAVEVLLNESRVLKSFSDFTLIAHKLIFPEHFFW